MQNEKKPRLPQRKVSAKAVSYKNYVGIGLGSIVGIGWLFCGYAGYLWRQRTKDMTREERDFQILGDYR